MAQYHDYPGVIHVHSTYSDGLKGVREIVRAAQEARCDYIILTDHDTLKALPQEGWYGQTILLVGEEITTGEKKGHYLALGLTSEVPPHQSPQETIAEVARQSGLGFLAHPYYRKNRGLVPLSPPWRDWSVTGFNGMEIWNYSVDWKENFGGLLSYPLGILCPDCFIEGPPGESLEKWDELIRGRRVVGIGSVDAHGYIHSYKEMFKTVRTHLLLNEALSFQPALFQKDKALIYGALKRGNCYLSYDYLANASGFMFSADNGLVRAIMGDELKLEEGVTLHVLSPRPGLLRLIHGGEVIASAANAASMVKTVYRPGAYRAEVLLNTYRGFKKVCRPWIYSNPIYVLGNG